MLNGLFQNESTDAPATDQDCQRDQFLCGHTSHWALTAPRTPSLHSFCEQNAHHSGLYIESEQHDIPFLDNVFFPLEPEHTLLSSTTKAANICKLIVSHSLCSDESALKVSVNHPCCLWCCKAILNGPRPCLLFTYLQKIG